LLLRQSLPGRNRLATDTSRTTPPCQTAVFPAAPREANLGFRQSHMKQEGDQHPPLRNSRTSPEQIRVRQTAEALCPARHKDGHPPDVRRSRRPCDLLTSAPKVVAGQAGHESGRSTVSSRRTAPKSSAIALSSAGTITAVSTAGRDPPCHAREPFTPPLRPADWVRTWGAPYGEPHVNRTCYGLLCHRRNGELANRRPSHYPVVGSRKNLSIPIDT
jgi:hypothetical protein